MKREEFSSEDEAKDFADTYDKELSLDTQEALDLGVIILTGSLNRSEERQAVEDAVKNVPGVRKVINEIAVKRIQ